MAKTFALPPRQTAEFLENSPKAQDSVPGDDLWRQLPVVDRSSLTETGPPPHCWMQCLVETTTVQGWAWYSWTGNEFGTLMRSTRQLEPVSVAESGWWQTHRSWLRTVALARSRDPAAVEEILQEVSLAVVRQGGLPTDEQLVGPWLYRVTVRQALLHRRRLGRRRRLTNRYGTELYGSERLGSGEAVAGAVNWRPDPLEWLLKDEVRQLVRIALGRLSTRDAELLLLKYTEHWSYRGLAEHLGLTERGVESRLERARERLRRELCRVDLSPAVASNSECVEVST